MNCADFTARLAKVLPLPSAGRGRGKGVLGSVSHGLLNMKLPRRVFLATTALAAARLSLGTAAETISSSSPAKKRPKLGISTYSYWHFRPPKISIETVIDKAAELGVGGVDILHRQMDLPEKEPLDAAGRSYLRKLKRHAFLNGIELICLSTHQNFVSPKPE